MNVSNETIKALLDDIGIAEILKELIAIKTIDCQLDPDVTQWDMDRLIELSLSISAAREFLIYDTLEDLIRFVLSLIDNDNLHQMLDYLAEREELEVHPIEAYEHHFTGNSFLEKIGLA
jgi:hypothetical protein